MTEDHVLHADIVVDEVGRAQDRGGNAGLLDHALDGMFGGEVQDIDTGVWSAGFRVRRGR